MHASECGSLVCLARVLQGWDALNMLTMPVRRRKGQKVDRRPDSAGGTGNKRERCFGVDAYWRQLDSAQRRLLMRAPLAKMAEGRGMPFLDTMPRRYDVRLCSFFFSDLTHGLPCSALRAPHHVQL